MGGLFGENGKKLLKNYKINIFGANYWRDIRGTGQVSPILKGNPALAHQTKYFYVEN